MPARPTIQHGRHKKFEKMWRHTALTPHFTPWWGKPLPHGRHKPYYSGTLFRNLPYYVYLNTFEYWIRMISATVIWQDWNTSQKIYNNYSMSPRWIWSDEITNERVARVGYNHYISNKGKWNNCFSKFSNRVLPPIFISTILQSENF